MSVAYYDAESEVLLNGAGEPFGTITRVYATTTQREIADGVTRDITETREVAYFYNRITSTPDSPDASANPGQPEKKENA